MGKKQGDFEKDLKNLNARIKAQEELNELENDISGLYRRSKAEQDILNLQEKQNLARKMAKGYADKGITLTSKEKQLYKDILKDTQKQLETNQKILNTEKNRLSVLQKMEKAAAGFLKVLPIEFFMQADSAIKSLNKELGLSGQRAEGMRQSMQDASVRAASLGASMQDLAQIQSTYADETGRAAGLTKQAQLSIVEIGKGTGLGVQQAAQLAGQFESMGVNAQGTANFVQGVMDTTERMGVNSTKVLKSVNENFKNLNKFTFQQGVKGFAEMASYAEKFKVDMGSMLDSAEKARTLEGAVELASQLQVMGGEFAKSDPFELLFLSHLFFE